MSFAMNPNSEVYFRENGELNSFNGVLNGNASEQAEILDGSVEGSLASLMLQLKQGLYAGLPTAEVLELMKLNNFENASTRSLFRVTNRILDESIIKKNGDITNRVTCILKQVVQEIEQRISRQAEEFKKQNNLYKSREKKYQSRLRALETLVVGTIEENEILNNRLQRIKLEKSEIEEKKSLGEQDLIRLKKEKDLNDNQISSLKQELEKTRKSHEEQCLLMETQTKQAKTEFEEKITELQRLLNDSKKRVKELEAFTESKFRRWKRKEHGYKSFIDFQSRSLQELRKGSESIKKEVLKTQKIYAEEFNHFGLKLQGLVDAAQNYHIVLAENRKLYNEVQDLKGNIRVYCRIRPFLPGQSQNLNAIEYIGDNGDLVVANSSKQGKDSHRLFKFNKVFGPAATQEEVFLDTQPLIRSVLDGYNVCIFAYGQTGSGKTYTMSGPNLSSKEEWGVNYRALNDLFHLSQSRKSSIVYEVGVQMVEIYNEQVRDLLTNHTSNKRLGIWNSSQPNGLAVPDASMHSVKSTGDVLELMKIGLMNRAVGATALNERSSRSHCVLTVHVRGSDIETNGILRGNLHLVDLAGSERVDRSEATGDRLREAQHINKSLSALGDVIYALAQKNSHVPYRNSKLTQVLQSSLGGQAKTLMFVQLNPDVESYSETISTLKFAERVSGVELGAARANKEGRGVRELMEQVNALKETVAKKDEEIGKLRLSKTNTNGEKCITTSPKYSSSSSFAIPCQSQTLISETSSSLKKVGSDLDNKSDCSDKYSESGSHPSMDDSRNHKENIGEDVELLGFGDEDSDERLSDISDSGLSMGTETDNISTNSIVELTLFPETAKHKAEIFDKLKSSVPVKLPRPPQKQAQTGTPRSSFAKNPTKILASGSKKLSGGVGGSSVAATKSSTAIKPVKRRVN
jgi:kinesin family protein C2/C3